MGQHGAMEGHEGQGVVMVVGRGVTLPGHHANEPNRYSYTLLRIPHMKMFRNKFQTCLIIFLNKWPDVGLNITVKVFTAGSAS